MFSPLEQYDIILPFSYKLFDFFTILIPVIIVLVALYLYNYIYIKDFI